eukprot:s105_g36.t1
MVGLNDFVAQSNTLSDQFILVDLQGLCKAYALQHLGRAFANRFLNPAAELANNAHARDGDAADDQSDEAQV